MPDLRRGRFTAKDPMPLPYRFTRLWPFLPREHGVAHVENKASVDTFWWSSPDLAYRIRFTAFDAALHARVMPLIEGRCNPATDGLYLADLEDVRRIVLAAPERLETVQSKTLYDDARRFAESLVRTHGDYLVMCDRMGRAVPAEERAVVPEIDAWEAAGRPLLED